MSFSTESLDARLERALPGAVVTLRDRRHYVELHGVPVADAASKREAVYLAMTIREVAR